MFWIDHLSDRQRLSCDVSTQWRRQWRCIFVPPYRRNGGRCPIVSRPRTATGKRVRVHLHECDGCGSADRSGIFVHSYDWHWFVGARYSARDFRPLFNTCTDSIILLPEDCHEPGWIAPAAAVHRLIGRIGSPKDDWTLFPTSLTWTLAFTHEEDSGWRLGPYTLLAGEGPQRPRLASIPLWPGRTLPSLDEALAGVALKRLLEHVQGSSAPVLAVVGDWVEWRALERHLLQTFQNRVWDINVWRHADRLPKPLARWHIHSQKFRSLILAVVIGAFERWPEFVLADDGPIIVVDPAALALARAQAPELVEQALVLHLTRER